MEDEPKELGSAGLAVREALFGGRSDAQIREQLRYVQPGTEGASMLEAELERRKKERSANSGWLSQTLRKLIG